MRKSHTVRTETTTLLVASLMLVVAASSPAAAQENCLETRGLVMTANVGPVAVSGHLAAALQQGNWDTRPTVRVTRMERESAREIGVWKAIWSVFDVELRASTAFVTADDQLIALDLHDPNEPTPLGSVNIVNAGRLAVAWNRAHVLSTGMDGNPRLDIVGVADPADMTPLGSLLWSSDDPEPRAMDADAGFVAIADEAGVLVVDARDRWNPVFAGRWSGQPSIDVGLVGRLAVVAPDATTSPDGFGVQILDLSRPNRPEERGFWPAPSPVVAVEAFGRSAAVATDGHGVFIVDLDDPDAPVTADQWDGYGLGAVDLAAAWPNLALANTQIGLVVLGLRQECMPPRQPSGRVSE